MPYVRALEGSEFTVSVNGGVPAAGVTEKSLHYQGLISILFREESRKKLVYLANHPRLCNGLALIIRGR
jgi:hypothetical protein